MRDYRYNAGGYHVFSLIGFMLRAKYSRYDIPFFEGKEVFPQ